MRPVDKARMRTLLATWAATKSEEMENCSWTLSTLKMGREESVRSCRLVVATPLVIVSKAIGGWIDFTVLASLDKVNT